MSGPLLATKLFVPPPRPNRVRRTRLRDLLTTRGSGVTLVAAPAGSGKSTLLADWAVNAGMPVAWLSLETADDDPRRFLLYLGGALRSANAVGATDVFDSMPSTQNALTAILSELINAVAARGAAAALVLDDFHAIESEAVHDLVQFFIDHIPPNLHLVIATRVDPPLALSRLRARDQLLEIRAADLRFTVDEAASFLNGAEGLGLTEAQVAELERRTEGWAVGLQMAAISMRGRTGETQSFIANFSGSNRYVLDYLTEEVLAWQSPDARSFLLQTSILGELSAPLCDAVTERTDGQRILQQLDAANLFLISLDEVRHWYRYHHLFATLLHDQLVKSTPATEVAALHRRAARWYASEGRTEQAIHHMVAGGDIDAAAALVAEHGLNRIAAGDAAAVVSWLRFLPPDIVEKRLDLLLPAALSLAVEFQLERAQAAVDHAKRIVNTETQPEERGAVLAVEGLIQRMSGHTEAALRLYEQSLPLLDPAETWFKVVTFDSSMASVMVTDLLKAEEGFRKVRSEGEKTKAFLPTILAQFMTGTARMWRGLPQDSFAFAGDALKWIERWDPQNLSGRPMAGLPYALLADLHRERNELDEAQRLAEAGVIHGKRGLFLSFFESMKALARVAEAQSDWEMAARCLDDAMRGVRSSGNPWWQATTGALQQRMILRRGQRTNSRADFDAVEAWCSRAGLFENWDTWRARRLPGWYAMLNFTIAARVLIERGRAAEAIDLTGRLLEFAIERQMTLAQIEILVVRAIAEGGNEGIGTMTEALDLAAGPGYIRSFADEDAAAAPLVDRAAGRAHDRDFATRVLNSFDRPLPKPVVSEDGLTDRELEVLGLIAQGATNQIAARKLFIAPSTVKKHLDNIYAKLQVGGRTQAIARARELNLL